MGDDGGGRRERKKRATRAALSEAALRLSVEHGLEELTVERIADEADVAVRTFFNYFSSKEEAVAAGDTATAEALVEAFAARPADEPVLTALRHAVLTVVEEDGYRERARRLRPLRRSPSLLPHQLAAYVARERALAEAVAARVGADVDRDLYPALVAASAMAGLRVVISRWLDEPASHGPTPDGAAGPGAGGDGPAARLSLAELVDRAIDQLEAGLGAPLPPAH